MLTGWPDARITIQNGQVQLSQPPFDTEYTDYSNNASLNLVNRETVYFNDFEDGNQPFYCYSDNWGGNTSGNGIIIVKIFYNVQELTWSSNGLEMPEILQSITHGYSSCNMIIKAYESWSLSMEFFIQAAQARRGIRLKAYYQLNGGAWQEFYSSPEDSYCHAGEQFSGFL